MKKLWLFILFLIISRMLCGNVYFKHLGKADGLSQISVVSICQDELGRMWFGTLEGLSCYDGNEMVVYKREFGIIILCNKPAFINDVNIK